MKNISRASIARTAGVAAIAAMAFIVGFEGKSNKVYTDPVGIKTVCAGHVYIGPNERPLKIGETFSDEVCNYLLAQDVQAAQLAVRNAVIVPLSEGELIAYTSLVYNVGAENFKHSTLLRKLNANDRIGACNELPRWNKGTIQGQKIVLPGLVKRRAAERAACLNSLKGTSCKLVEKL